MPDAAAVINNAMTEKKLFEHVRAHLEMFRWLWYHTYDSRRSNGGFPDIVATQYTDMRFFDPNHWRARVIYVELKSEQGRLGFRQKIWLEHLRRSRMEVHVWRPSDLASGLIERVLRGSNE
jgi:hypothetical protein